MTKTASQSIRSEQVYSWSRNTRRYHLNGQAIGSLFSPRPNEWTVRFTRPQPSNLPWTEFHTPAILAEYTFATDAVKTADEFAQTWLEGEHHRDIFGDEIADIVADFFALAAAAS